MKSNVIIVAIAVLQILPVPAAADEPNVPALESAKAMANGQELAIAAMHSIEKYGWPKYVGDAGVIVAEGDSWFAYPKINVLKVLERKYQFDVEEVASNGDTLESMAYDIDQLSELADKLKQLSDKGIKPKAILLSGGGNDIAGPEFRMFLNHARSGNEIVSSAVSVEVIGRRLKFSLVSLLTSITSISIEFWGEPIPILVHGYDYPIPDGRHFRLVKKFGPWLKPSFEEKGYTDDPDYLETAKAAMVILIDEYNTMIESVADEPAFRSHVRYVSLTGTLSSDDDYKDDWHNELHPSREKDTGFFLIAAKFATELSRLP